MTDVNTLMQSPSQIVYVYLAFWALSALAHTMPKPDDNSRRGYRWVYNLLQFVLANLSQFQRFITKPVDPVPPGT